MESTVPFAINARGAVTGTTVTGTGPQAFVRSASGTIVTFTVEGSVKTSGVGIDSKGDVAGYYIVPGGIGHGFIRTHRSA
jgi:hypothetical protein